MDSILCYMHSAHTQRHPHLLSQNPVTALMNRNGRRERTPEFEGLCTAFPPRVGKSGLWTAEEGEDLVCVLPSVEWND